MLKYMAILAIQIITINHYYVKHKHIIAGFEIRSASNQINPLSIECNGKIEQDLIQPLTGAKKWDRMHGEGVGFVWASSFLRNNLSFWFRLARKLIC